MSQEHSRRLALALMLLIFIAFNAWVLFTFVTSKYPGANDFYQRWRGARAFWVEHRDPYGKDVSRQVELDLYGAPASTDPALDQYPGDFLYTMPTAILIAPLAVLPYDIASAIWLALTGTAVAAAFALAADLYNWRPAPWLLGVGIAWAITFYPAVRGLFLGQPGTIGVCLQIIALWALAKKHDTTAGVVLALSTFKLQLGLLLLPFLMLWAVRSGRRRFVVTFAVVAGALYVVSFLLLPSWLGEWLAQTAQYTSYTRIGSPVWIVANIYLAFLGQPGELATTTILVGLVLWSCFLVIWRRDDSLFDWTAALSLTVTHLILVRTATPHFVVYLLVIVFYFRELYRSGGPWPVVAAMILLTVGLWWLFLATLVNRFESPAVYLPLPWGSLILMLITWRRWRQPTPAPLRYSPRPAQEAAR